MKYFFRILSIIIISGVIWINFVFGAVNLVEGYNLFSPYIDTEFAPNFTIEKSKNIKIGQTKNEVIKLVGNPLYISKSYYGDLMFSYTSDGFFHKKKSHGSSSICDFAWFGYDVVFDKENNVKEIQLGWRYD